MSWFAVSKQNCLLAIGAAALVGTAIAAEVMYRREFSKYEAKRRKRDEDNKKFVQHYFTLLDGKLKEFNKKRQRVKMGKETGDPSGVVIDECRVLSEEVMQELLRLDTAPFWGFREKRKAYVQKMQRLLEKVDKLVEDEVDVGSVDA